MFTKSISNFIMCSYDSNKQIGGITIFDTTTDPFKSVITYNFRKRDMEDAVACRWFLFEHHDEIWIPTLKDDGQLDKDNPLIITSKSTDQNQLAHVTFKQYSKPFQWITYDYKILQDIHEFWKDMIDFKEENNESRQSS